MIKQIVITYDQGQYKVAIMTEKETVATCHFVDVIDMYDFIDPYLDDLQ